jgi:hypothetical protein
MTQKPNNKSKDFLISLALLAAVGVAIAAALSIDPMGQRGAGTGRDYDKDFQKLKKFNLALVKWSEELPAIPTGMKTPQAVTVLNDGTICLGGDKSLVTMSPDGQKRRRTELSFEPQALAAYGHLIYIASKNSIFVINSTGDGLTQGVALSDDKTRLVSLAVSNEYIYAADAGNRVVVRYERKTGKRTYKDGHHESGAFMSGFNVPSPHLDIAITHAGEILTVDPGRSLVQTRDIYGDVLKSWGQEGSDIAKFYGCCNPAAIAALDDGSVVTYEKTLQRVKVYTPDGMLSNVVAGPNEFTDQPKDTDVVADIAVDRKGRVLVLDPIRKTVRIFKRKIAPRPTTGAAR